MLNLVSSRELNTGSKRTLPGNEGEVKEYGACERSPLSRTPVWSMNRTYSSASALTTLNMEMCSPSENPQQEGTKFQKKRNNRTYLGVRVKMPVKDMLRDIRIANGMDPKEIQRKTSKESKGDKKRVNTSNDRKKRQKKWQTKSLEELAIIVEVLEEDLKTSTSRQSSNPLPNLPPELRNKFWVKKVPQQEHPPTNDYANPKKTPMHCVEIEGSEYGQAALLFTDTKIKTGGSEFDCYLPRKQHELTCFQRDSKIHVTSPQEIFFNTKADWWGSPHKVGSSTSIYSEQKQWDSMTYIWTQMERETHLLNSFSIQELFNQDEKGRILLHRVVIDGNRSLVYVLARQMADLNKLDSKDAEGRTSLHLAAEKNQHLMVADLISLGANINEKDHYGKTCLHLGAEYGYVKVLEVLKSYMTNGIYIDLEAQDVNGLRALQLASLSLKSIVGDLEKSVTASQERVRLLRKEQMMKTLECLLQMECNLQSLVRDEGNVFHCS